MSTIWRLIPICLAKGHLWDSERPRGPLGYLPDRCWRCDKTRALPGYDKAELIRRQRAAEDAMRIARASTELRHNKENS